jgi:hypothetical protein
VKSHYPILFAAVTQKLVDSRHFQPVIKLRKVSAASAAFLAQTVRLKPHLQVV